MTVCSQLTFICCQILIAKHPVNFYMLPNIAVQHSERTSACTKTCMLTFFFFYRSLGYNLNKQIYRRSETFAAGFCFNIGFRISDRAEEERARYNHFCPQAYRRSTCFDSLGNIKTPMRILLPRCLHGSGLDYAGERAPSSASRHPATKQRPAADDHTKQPQSEPEWNQAQINPSVLFSSCLLLVENQPYKLTAPLRIKRRLKTSPQMFREAT